MSKAQAEAKLKSMGVTAKPAAPKKKEVPDYSGMTKTELEAFMREYGVELDRRKTKASLMKEVEEYFNG